MTGEGNPLKRLVPEIGREGIREICEDRVVGAAKKNDRRIDGVNIDDIY